MRIFSVAILGLLLINGSFSFAEELKSDIDTSNYPDIIVCKIKSGLLWNETYFYYGFTQEESIHYFRIAPKKGGDKLMHQVVVILSKNTKKIQTTLPINDPRLPKIEFGNCSVGTTLKNIVDEGRAKYF